MTADAAGWWTVDVDVDVDAEPVTYGFVLDDDPTPLPDPRSRFQPEGVHGLSQTYDSTQFVWTDADWAGRSLAGGVIYELHLGTFTATGTLDAAIERLPHLVELGIDFVELLPVNAFNGTRNWGYDGVLWYCVDDRYGGPAAYHASSTPATDSASLSSKTSSTTTLARAATTCRASAHICGMTTTPHGAPRSTSTTLKCAGMSSTTRRCGSVTITSTTRARRCPRAGRHVSQAHPPRTGGDDGEAVGGSRPPAHAHRRIRPQRSDDDHAHRRRRVRIDAQWSDDFHHAVHVALTGSSPVTTQTSSTSTHSPRC